MARRARRHDERGGRARSLSRLEALRAVPRRHARALVVVVDLACSDTDAMTRSSAHTAEPQSGCKTRAGEEERLVRVEQLCVCVWTLRLLPRTLRVVRNPVVWILLRWARLLRRCGGRHGPGRVRASGAHVRRPRHVRRPAKGRRREPGPCAGLAGAVQPRWRDGQPWRPARGAGVEARRPAVALAGREHARGRAARPRPPRKRPRRAWGHPRGPRRAWEPLGASGGPWGPPSRARPSHLCARVNWRMGRRLRCRNGGCGGRKHCFHTAQDCARMVLHVFIASLPPDVAVRFDDANARNNTAEQAQRKS